MLKRCGRACLLTIGALLMPWPALASPAPRYDHASKTMKAQSSQAGSGARTSNALSGPVLGFAFDPAADSFRPLRGLAGASVLGEPLKFSLPIDAAEIAPGKDFAIATVGDDRVPAVIRLGDDPVSVIWIDGASPAPSGIYISPGATAAVLYYKGARKLQIVSGLPSSPYVSNELALAGLSPTPSTIAISDDASVVLLAISEQDSGSVVLLRGDGAEQFLLPAGPSPAITFLTGSNSALVADPASNRVYLLQDIAGALKTFTLAAAQDGVREPLAISVTADNRRAFVLNSKGGTLVALDLAGGPSQILTCPCQPAEVRRLMAASVFGLTEPSTNPMWILDADSPTPRIVFVPPPKPLPEAAPPARVENGAPL